MRDSNGLSRLVQAIDQNEAEQRHKELLADSPFTTVELARIKQMLHANYVLSDR
jgi:hypothetical protein